MRVTINGKSEELNHPSMTILELLQENKVEAVEMVAVQHNGSFLAHDQFSTTFLAAEDEVEFLYFKGGGAQQ